MRGLSVLIVVSLALGGCFAPAATRDDETGGADGVLPSSLDVDLREYILNITMPEGQPTMLVALNVTEEMWVRPWAGGFGRETLPVEDETYWTLCPMIRSWGLPKDARWTSLVFWLDAQELRPASQTLGSDKWGDADGWRCAAGISDLARFVSIREDVPRAGILVLLLTLWEPGDETPTPEFRFQVGIAREMCDQTNQRRCPPQESRSAEPIRRSGLPIHSAWDTAAYGPSCDPCGFELTDSRTAVGPAASGTIHLTRDGEVSEGITLVRAIMWPGTPTPALQRGSVRLALSIAEQESEGTCMDTSPVGGSGLEILVGHHTAPRADITFDETGVYDHYVHMVEIPLAFGELALGPVLATPTDTYTFTGTTGGTCG